MSWDFGPPLSANLQVATGLVAAGKPVFPCAADKKPLVPGGFKSATTDPAHIGQWWSTWPTALVGLPTGEASGLAVLDLDVAIDPDTGEVLKDGGKHLAALMARETWALPDTVEVSTPRGGRHLYFKHENGFRCSTGSEGIDARGTGGYVIAGGSVLPDGRRYAFTNPEPLFQPATSPEWLAHFFRTGKFLGADPAMLRQDSREGAGRASQVDGCESSRNSQGPQADSVRALAGDSGETNADDVAAALAEFWNPDDYSDWSKAAMCLHSIPGGREVWLSWAARSPKFDRAENLRKWDVSEPTRGLTARSVLARAPREWLSDRAKARQPHYAMFESKGLSVAPEKSALPPLIKATPYGWPAQASIPPRQWLYGRHLIRGFVSVTVAPGGVGKSSLAIVDALAMASGRDLLGSVPAGPLRVWLFNGEDPADELDRRLAAAAQHYGITASDCTDPNGASRLYRDSGREMEIVVATQQRDGVVIIEPVVTALIAEIKARKIDVLVVDPFVSCHTVPENDNGAIDRVAKLWARVAHETGCAIELVHHSRKTGGMEVTVEHARGAVALIAAARSVRVLNSMTKEDAAKAGIADSPRSYFSVDNGKANLAPPPDGKAWFRLESVDLGNGGAFPGTGPSDHVGVVTPWEWPGLFDGIESGDLLKAQRAVAAAPMTQCRESLQARWWVGHVVGEAIGIDTSDKPGRSRVAGILKVWTQNGMFRVVEGEDEKRMPRKVAQVGTFANS